MKPVFENPVEAEKYIKDVYSFPQYIMMENAAAKLADSILNKWYAKGSSFESVIFICGKGNNGADGLACARRLYKEVPVFIYCPELPSTEEGIAQSKMCSALKIPFINQKKLFNLLKEDKNKIIVDCLYGTGFHGNLKPEIKELLDLANKAQGFKIACDIPSALYFCADQTITMGSLKTTLYADKAKDVCGTITVADLGISRTLFEETSLKLPESNKNLNSNFNIYLIEENDIRLPERKNKNTHKGTYGHSVIIAGEKSGAALLASEAALNFGSGLTSVLESPFSNAARFKVSPSLMLTTEFPKNARAVQIGSGLGDTEKLEVQKIINQFDSWFTTAKNPAAVLDADMFSYKNLASLLKKLNNTQNARIVLTPHAKELASLVKLTGLNISQNELNPAMALEQRIEIGRAFTKKYPSCVLVMKGANTFIAEKGQIYIYEGFGQCLSKGGSGDVLAGMITSLLAQNYSALDAALTAVWRHGQAAREFGSSAYNLTPQKLIKSL